MDPLRTVLDRGFVALVDEPSSDLKVVNAARISFAKKSTWEHVGVFDGTSLDDPRPPDYAMGKRLKAADAALIRYLASHNHWTPFAHCRFLYSLRGSLTFLEAVQNEGVRWKLRDHDGSKLWLSTSLWTAARWGLPIPANHMDASYDAILKHAPQTGFGVDMLQPQEQPRPWSDWPEEEPVTLHIKMPIFVARQWMKSNVGIVYNEISRRYVEDLPEFHVPSKWRGRPDTSMKQGSSGELRAEVARRCGVTYNAGCFTADDGYQYYLSEGVAPEQARIILPVSHYTEVWMTCSLQALARVLKLRLDPHAQWETRQYAQAVREIVEPKYPVLTRLLDE